jgi:hypothetical protein
MLAHDVETFVTLAIQMDALLQAETHYIKQHQYEEAIKLLLEKNRLFRDYEKVCVDLSENQSFPILAKDKRDEISKIAQSLHLRMNENKTTVEHAMIYSENIMDIYIQSKKETHKGQMYGANGKRHIYASQIIEAKM